MVKTLPAPPARRQQGAPAPKLNTSIDKSGGPAPGSLRAAAAARIEALLREHGAAIAAATGKYVLSSTDMAALRPHMQALTYARFNDTRLEIRHIADPVLNLTRRLLSGDAGKGPQSPLQQLIRGLPSQAVQVKQDGAVLALFGHFTGASEMTIALRARLELREDGLAVTKILANQVVGAEHVPEGVSACQTARSASFDAERKIDHAATAAMQSVGLLARTRSTCVAEARPKFFEPIAAQQRVPPVPRAPPPTPTRQVPLWSGRPGEPPPLRRTESFVPGPRIPEEPAPDEAADIAATAMGLLRVASSGPRPQAHKAA